MVRHAESIAQFCEPPIFNQFAPCEIRGPGAGVLTVIRRHAAVEFLELSKYSELLFRAEPELPLWSQSNRLLSQLSFRLPYCSRCDP